MMKLIIAGGRDFDHYDFLKKSLDFMLSGTEPNSITILCGCAKGADLLGERYAKERGITVEYFVPNWIDFGKSAGMIRNKEMLDHATHLIAYWDRESRGTKHMIGIAEKKGIPVKVYHYAVKKLNKTKEN